MYSTFDYIFLTDLKCFYSFIFIQFFLFHILQSFHVFWLWISDVDVIYCAHCIRLFSFFSDFFSLINFQRWWLNCCLRIGRIEYHERCTILSYIFRIPNANWFNLCGSHRFSSATMSLFRFEAEYHTIQTQNECISTHFNFILHKLYYNSIIDRPLLSKLQISNRFLQKPSFEWQ